MRGLEAGVLGTVSHLCRRHMKQHEELENIPRDLPAQSSRQMEGRWGTLCSSMEVSTHTFTRPQAPPPWEQSLTRGRILVDLCGLWDLETLCHAYCFLGKNNLVKRAWGGTVHCLARRLAFCGLGFFHEQVPKH